MLPAGSMPKTCIGIPLSMQRLNAVESTTLSPWTSACWYEMVSSFLAFGSMRGSAV